MRWTKKNTTLWVVLGLLAVLAVVGWQHRARQLDYMEVDAGKAPCNCR